MKIEEFKKGFNGAEAEFKNEYGEKFVLFYEGLSIYFGGDETDQEVIPLFNPQFSVWSRDELHTLGNAICQLVEIYEKHNKKLKE